MAAAAVGCGCAAAMPAPPKAQSAAALYADAEHSFAAGDVQGGLVKLDRAVVADPKDTEAWALRALWAGQQGDRVRQADSLGHLAALDPVLRERVIAAEQTIRATSAELPDPFPSTHGADTAIVVLGYGLMPDGTMRPELIDRLQAAWAQAAASPASPIITTGGDPRSGVTEAQAMAGWLLANGIPAWRIHPETQSDSTAQNALFATPIIKAVGAKDAVIVTSANHIRRGTADFEIAGIPVIGGTAAYTGLFESDNWLGLIAEVIPVNPHDQTADYADAATILGLG
jgi:uncharacterized SAM-binding protein YcdF (DUF218 family)